MNKSGAWMFIFTLGISSLLTFALGLVLGYALFSPRIAAPTTPPPMQVAEQAPEPEPIPPQQEPTPERITKPEVAVDPVVETSEAEPETEEPVAVIAEPAKPDYQVARHLFIAVNGQWLADGTRSLLEEIQPGGIVLRPGNITSRNQSQSLVKEIKATSGGAHAYDWPLIIASQEGGTNNTLRLADASMAADLGRENNQQEARRIGNQYGKTAVEYGVNVILGPVLDVYDDATAFPELRSRSFGSDQMRVANLGMLMAEGIRSGGVISVAKHFPGYASASYSSDGISVVMNQNFEGLAKAMYPFSEAATKQVQGMVVGHVAVPLLDKDNPFRSAALSPTMVTTLLRNRWNYNGVLIADEIAFNEMTRSHPVERAAVEALIAGCDAVIFMDPNPRNIRSVIESIERAIEQGEISIEQLNASKERLEEWRLTLGAQPFVEPAPVDAQVAMLQEVAGGISDESVEMAAVEAVDVPALPEPEPVEDPVEEPTEVAVEEPEEMVVAELVPETVATEPEIEIETVSELVDADVPEMEASDEEAPVVVEPIETDENMVVAEAVPEDVPEVVDEPAEEEVPEPEAPVTREVVALDKAIGDSTLVKIDYEVQPNETILQIAWAYDVATEDIIRWNGLDSAVADAGTTLVLYVPEKMDGQAPTTEPEPAPSEDEPEMVAEATDVEPDAIKEEVPAEESPDAPEEPIVVAQAEPETEEVAVEEPVAEEPEMDTPSEAENTTVDEPVAEEPPMEEEAVAEESPQEPTDVVVEDLPSGEPALEEPTPDTPAEPIVVAEALPEPEMVEEALTQEFIPIDAVEPEMIKLEPDAEPVKDEPIKMVHQVQWGDTLSSIAQDYGVRISEIRAWNEMDDDEKLQANTSLIIYVTSMDQIKVSPAPETKSTSESVGAKLATYTVATGDTMTKIAREHQTSVETIVSMNQLKNANSIWVGQKLKVPSIN